MKETDDGNFTIEIAAYGVQPICTKRPMCLWDKTYSIKLSEGYIDRTGYCRITGSKEHAPIENADIAALWKELNQYSRQAIEENYDIHISEVSDEMAQINKNTIHPYDCLYCHGGPGCSLRNDECVLPFEEQVTIQYLIELEM